MTTVMLEEMADEQEASETRAPETAGHVEEDGVDWCAWWAAYSETME